MAYVAFFITAVKKISKFTQKMALYKTKFKKSYKEDNDYNPK